MAWTLGDLWGARNVSKTTVRDLLGMTSSVPDFDTANPCFPSALQAHRPDAAFTLYDQAALRAPRFTKLALGQRLVAPAVQGLFAALGGRSATSTGFMLLGMVLGVFQNATCIAAVDQSVYLLLPSKVAQVSSQVESRQPPHARPRE